MNILKRIYRKIQSKVFFMLSIERFTLTKVYSSNDIRVLGTEYGGWAIPVSLFNEKSVCYCVGCGEDISFDLELINQFDCDVFAFDPTPRAIEYVRKHTSSIENYKFYDFGLWDKEDVLKFYTPRNPAHVSHSLLNLQNSDEFIEVKVRRLKDVMISLGHSKLDLLKLDVEGAEYKIIDSILEDNLNIKVICVEYDECFNALDKKYKERIKQSIMGLLSLGYVQVYDQGNCNYTFVRKDLCA